MTWTAKLKEAKSSGDKWDILIEYTNGTVTRNVGYQVSDASDDNIKALARGHVNSMQIATSTAPTMLPNTDIDLTPPTGPTPSPPLPAEQVTWLANWQTLQKYNRLIDAGIVSSTTPAYLSLKSTVKNTWLESYMGSL